MFEYLASGVPIVSSNLPVLKEILRHGENCLLVEPDNLSAWLSAIDTIEVDRSLADRLGKNAHTDYKKNYTWKRRAEKIIELLNDD
jgi:glycosyltransferase involved in cell wall biosynthesis